jgi:hypothetical protein
METVKEKSIDVLIDERLELAEKVMRLINESLRSGHLDKASALLGKVLGFMELPPEADDGSLVYTAYFCYVECLKSLKALLDGSIGVHDFRDIITFSESFCELSLDSIEKTTKEVVHWEK